MAKYRTCPHCELRIDTRGFTRHVKACGRNCADKFAVGPHSVGDEPPVETPCEHDINYCPRCGFQIGVLLALMAGAK